MQQGREAEHDPPRRGVRASVETEPVPGTEGVQPRDGLEPAPVVDDPGLGDELHPPSATPGTLAELGLLGVEEEGLVEAAEVVEGLGEMR